MMSLKLLARFHNRIFTGKVGFVSRQQIRFSNLKKLDEKAQDTQEPKEPPEQKSQFNWKPVVIAGIGGLVGTLKLLSWLFFSFIFSDSVSRLSFLR